MTTHESVVTRIARTIAKETNLMLELVYADILYNPTYYYKDYVRSGGELTPKEWVLLCERERKPVKNRKSLR